MNECSICGESRHSAMYCPFAVDERVIRRRLAEMRRGGSRPPMTVRRVDEPPMRTQLRSAVERQVLELTADLDGWQGGEEMPRAAAEYDRYEDAFASARKACGHKDVDNVEHRRTWYCIDCRQYLSYRQMYNARGNHQWWSW